MKTICNECVKMVEEYREYNITTYSGQGHISHQDPNYVIHICKTCEDTDINMNELIAIEFTRIMKMEGKDGD